MVAKSIQGRFLFWPWIFFILLISGCEHTPVTRTVFEALSDSNKDLVDKFKTNPNLRYLRVTVKNRPVLMVLGYTEQHLDGKIEIWYSNTGQVIRLQNGRIVGTVGLEIDWLNVNHSSLPSWNQLDKDSKAIYQRKRDQMPGYRFGIIENVSIYRTPPPTNSKIAKVSPNKLRWYEEVALSNINKLPSARFAVLENDGLFNVVYGEQCLTEVFCLAWQTWPALQ